MKWNDHSDLEGKHAFLSPSKYHWHNYSKEKLIQSYLNAKAKEEGTKTHEFAAQCINRGQRLPEEDITLNMYVNDAISYKMRTEQVLYISKDAFGSADAISYRDKRKSTDGVIGVLRIHDLKTGVTPASFKQLITYAAYFCQEYKKDPAKLDITLCIYQNNEVQTLIPDPEEIRKVMEVAVSFSKDIYEIEKGLKL